MLYLDNNATTRPSDAVLAAMDRAQREHWQNPSSVHRGGQGARQQVELARAEVARLIGASPREVIFTSGGTEALDMAIRGALDAWPRDGVRILLTTRVEHAAIRDLAEELARPAWSHGPCEVRWLPVDGQGRVDIAGAVPMIVQAGEDVRRARGVLVVVLQWANNETGAIQPVGEVARACRTAGGVSVVDATQWVGKMPTDLGDAGEPAGALPIDLMACAPHKFHGPKGVGVLWARQGVRVRPRLLGTQELGRRGGTEHVAGIVGAGVAAAEALEWLADVAGRERGRALRDRFESAVLAGAEGARVNGPVGPGAPRLWNTTNIAFPHLEAEALLLLLSEQGVAASAGAACSSGSLDPSPVLLAMGIDEHLAHGSVRFSLSRWTTQDEIERAAEIVVRCVGRLRNSWHG